VGHDNNLVEVVDGEDLGDRETGGFSIKRRVSYPIADWEHLNDYDTEIGVFFRELPDKREVGQEPDPDAMQE